jgi:hypothetical protein
MMEHTRRLRLAFRDPAWIERLGWLRRSRFDDGGGLPPATRAAERAGDAAAWLAALFVALVGTWEITGPFAAGHYTASTAVVTGGENMLRWHVLAPVTSYTLGPPSQADFYCHHPFGLFWTGALFSALFGHHDWVCRLPAVLMTALMPRLVFGACRALYGPIAGGLAALAYVVVPITLAYANYLSLEVATMFGMALATYGFARFFQTDRMRFGVLGVLGLSYAAACDWPGFLFGALVLGGLFLRGFVLGARFAPLRFEPFARVWAWAVVALTALAVFHLAVLVKLEHVSELLRQGEFRTLGAEQPLAQVLAQRRYWLLLAFTPLVIVAGKLALPLFALRLVIRRREMELFPLALLATAVAQYVVFKQGADIHFFWPQYFALYFAYSAGALVAAFEGGLGWAVARRSLLPRRPLVAWLAGAVGLACVLAVLPDGLRGLVYARKTGGRFNERGSLIQPDFDKEAAFAAVAKTLPPDAVVGVSNGMKQSYWMDWVLRRPVRYAGLPRAETASVSTYALDSRFDTRGAVESLTREFAVQAIGPFFVANTAAEPAPVEGWSTVPRRLGGLERWLTATTHDVYDIVKDPFWTWELRTHLNQTPNPPPRAAPASSEQLRIAHNLAVSEHDDARAERLLNQLLASVDRGAARKFSEGVELLGARLERSASLRLTLYFRAGAALPTDTEFKLFSRVTAPPALSLVPADELVWDVGMPFAMPTSLWRPGFVYSTVTEILRRPGRERYDGAFYGPVAPTEIDGRSKQALLTLD